MGTCSADPLAVQGFPWVPVFNRHPTLR